MSDSAAERGRKRRKRNPTHEHTYSTCSLAKRSKAGRQHSREKKAGKKRQKPDQSRRHGG